MILDGSGDGLQIHWSLTRQRFDSSFPATELFCLYAQASARACIGAAWQLNDKAWSPHMPPCLCQERRPKGHGRPYGCLYKEVYGLLATVINALSQ